MTETEFRQELLREQFAAAVPQWHPKVDDLIAGTERVRLLEQRAERAA